MKILVAALTSAVLVMPIAPVSADVKAESADPGPVPAECLPWTEPLESEVNQLRGAFEEMVATYDRDTSALNVQLGRALWKNQLLRDRVKFLKHDLRLDARIGRHQRKVIRNQRAEIRDLRAQLASASQ